MHPFDMNLTSTTPRQIIPRLEDSVSRLGVAHTASKSPILDPAFRGARVISRAMQLFHISTKRGSTYFLLPFSLLRTYLIFMGQSSTLFNHIWAPSLYFIPFTPPTLGGGTYAIIGRRSHLESCTCNLHTYFSLVVKILVCESKHTQATIDRDPNYRYKHSR